RRRAGLTRHARLDHDVERVGRTVQPGHVSDADRVRAARHEGADRAVVLTARGREIEKHLREEALALTEPGLAVAQLQGGALRGRPVGHAGERDPGQAVRLRAAVEQPAAGARPRSRAPARARGYA